MRKAVVIAGSYYGRKTIHGLLRSRGIHISQHRVSQSLSRVSPSAVRARRHFSSRHFNPLPYHALFYGEKLHLDQNEKLNRFGVTHILAVDGFSRKIVGLITIPIKNPIAIYHALLRPLLLSSGMWEQLRVDHGTEFSLIITIQKYLAQLFPRQYRHHHFSVLQSTSTQNHRVERLRVEINQRVNYPLKRILVRMEGNGMIDLSNPIIKFCVSYCSISVTSPALLTFVASWNNHRISGSSGGIPNVLAASRHNTTLLLSSQIPTTDQAINLFTINGGSLTPESPFGHDPLGRYPHLQKLRERDFRNAYPSPADIFCNVLHSDGAAFTNYVLFFIQLTGRFSSFIET